MAPLAKPDEKTDPIGSTNWNVLFGRLSSDGGGGGRAEKEAEVEEEVEVRKRWKLIQFRTVFD